MAKVPLATHVDTVSPRDNRTDDPRSSSPFNALTATREGTEGADLQGGLDFNWELASDKVIRLKSRANLLEGHISGLEKLAHGFERAVGGVVREYQELKEELDRYGQDFEALEIDHVSTVGFLMEERHTAAATTLKS